MKLTQILSYVRKAVDDYEMIKENDKIAVGVSGGKDSLVLLAALANLRIFYPNKFSIVAITVSLGFKDMDFSPVAKLCDELDVPYFIQDTDIGEIIFDERKEKNPCSLCSKMRKGALNDKAKSLGCNKVALGHNNDDLIHTFFMSLFYEGRLHCFSPVTHMDRIDLYTIRPLAYAPETDIKRAIRNNDSDLIIVKNTCPVDGYTKREEIKKFVNEQCKTHNHFMEKVFGAMKRGNISGWGGSEANGGIKKL